MKEERKPSWLAYVGLAGMLFIAYTMGKTLWVEESNAIDVRNNKPVITEAAEIEAQEREKSFREYIEMRDKVEDLTIRISFNAVFSKLNSQNLEGLVRKDITNIPKDRLIIVQLRDGAVIPVGYYDANNIVVSIFE